MNKEQAMTKQPSFLAKATEKLLKNKLAALCFVLLVLEVLLLLITPWIAPHDPEATNAAIKFAPGFWAKFSSDRQSGPPMYPATCWAPTTWDGIPCPVCSGADVSPSPWAWYPLPWACSWA